MKTKLILYALGLALTAIKVVQAQSAAPSPGTPSVLPRPDFHFHGNVRRTYLDSDPPQFPQPVQAPKGAPNVVLILLDDAGFGQFSTFGGGVPSPTYKGKASERGQPAAVTMMVNGMKVAEGQIPKTIPLQISLGEGLDIGMDVGSPVDFTYKLPFRFTGTIDKVTIELK